jgi:hypothetical protein
MLKDNFTIERAEFFLKSSLPFQVNVTIRKNLLDSNKKWLDVDKDSFVGVRVSFYSDRPLVNSYVPNFAARAFFGGLITGVFHHGSRNQFEKQVEKLLLSEFYGSSGSSSFAYSGGHNAANIEGTETTSNLTVSPTVSDIQSEQQHSNTSSSYKSGDLYK